MVHYWNRVTISIWFWAPYIYHCSLVLKMRLSSFNQTRASSSGVSTSYKIKETWSNWRCTKYRSRQDTFNGWGSYSDSPPHWGELLLCFIQPPRVCTRKHAFDLLWKEVKQEQLLKDFLNSHDPSDIMRAMSMPYLPTIASNFDKGVISIRLQKIFILSIDSPPWGSIGGPD